MNSTSDENVLRHACQSLLARLGRSSPVASESKVPVRRGRRRAFLSMLLAGSIGLIGVPAGYAQMQNARPAAPASVEPPNSNADMNAQQPQDRFVSAMIHLLKKHQGKIGYDDIEPIMREAGCVNDTYSVLRGTHNDDKAIGYALVKSHCPDGGKLTYVGESTIRKENSFKYHLNVFWYPSSKTDCIPAEYVAALIKAHGWTIDVPPMQQGSVVGPPRPNNPIPNDVPYQSSEARNVTLDFHWTLPGPTTLSPAASLEESCLASLIFSEQS
jgi:hypothetical protein